MEESNSQEDDTEDINVKVENDENIKNNISTNDLKCDECGKQCKSKTSFTNHKHYHKLCLTGIYCEKCDRKVPKKLWQRHLAQVHEPKSPKNNKPLAHIVPREGAFESYSDSNFR